jgi:hypothetical protein
MADFPQLRSGAIAQYPAHKTTLYSTSILCFVDGSEQRYREYGSALRQWRIELDQLDESELARIESFFISQQGIFGEFSFVDPWDGTEYPNCSLEDGELALRYIREGKGQTSLVIRQNRV